MNDRTFPPRADNVIGRTHLFYLLAICWLGWAAHGHAGALEDYVSRADTNFTWKQLDQKEADGYKITHLEMVSQNWRDHLWRHHLQVVRPAKVRNPGIA